MAAQYLTDWNPLIKIGAHTGILSVIDGATDPGKITIHSSTDVLLATLTLDDPGGAVNGTTGQLSLTPAENYYTVAADGVASYATLRDGNDTALRSANVQQGSSAVSGYCVLIASDLYAGRPVALVSWTIG